MTGTDRVQHQQSTAASIPNTSILPQQSLIPSAVFLNPATGQPIPIYLNNPGHIITLPMTNDMQLTTEQLALLTNQSAATTATTATAPSRSKKRKAQSDATGSGQQQQQTTLNKAELRAIKNRESAARSRAKRLEYTASLEAKVEQLRQQNKTLRTRVIQVAAAPPDPHAGVLEGRPLRRTRTAMM